MPYEGTGAWLIGIRHLNWPATNGYRVAPGSTTVSPVAYRRSNTRDLITASAVRAGTAIVDARVNRVLNLLSDQMLATRAAEHAGTPGLASIESVDLPHVREHPLIVARVAELENQGIAIEFRQVERVAAGMTFAHWVIRIRY